MTVTWCNPPRTGGGLSGVTAWTRRIIPVMERPGEWALVRDDFVNPSSSYNAQRDLRNGRSAPDRPAGVWEFRAGRLPDGHYRWGVWARWFPIDDTTQREAG